MNQQEMNTLMDQFLDAWNSQNVEAVIACYTEDLYYLDPNTKGPVTTPDGMRRYLTKLFAAWKMTWATREGHPLAEKDGAAFLWHATFQRPGGGKVVEADGMDLVIIKNGRIARNEVYFDRAILAPLLMQ